MRIPVTRNFNATDCIGTLTLTDGVEIPPDTVFALAYTVAERDSDGKPSKISLESVSLVPDSNYLEYLKGKDE